MITIGVSTNAVSCSSGLLLRNNGIIARSRCRVENDNIGHISYFSVISLHTCHLSRVVVDFAVQFANSLLDLLTDGSSDLINVVMLSYRLGGRPVPTSMVWRGRVRSVLGRERGSGWSGKVLRGR